MQVHKLLLALHIYYYYAFYHSHDLSFTHARV